MTTASRPLVAILGPTGSGKSELGIWLAQQTGGEIVSCDSIQVHSELNVGSAKVPIQERREIPHHLIDVIGLDQKLTAGAYARLARTAISEIEQRKRLPIIVGGTGLYLRALVDGLSPAPARDEEFRGRLRTAAEKRPGVLSRYLRRFDHASSIRIHANDRQKMTRAVELCHVSQKPASVIHSIPREKLSGCRVLKIGLAPDRNVLYDRLDSRVEWMFANGLLEETKSLIDLHHHNLPEALGSLGYLQAVKYWTRELSLEDAISECQVRTRNYAKRQLTWFRGDRDIQWINSFGSDDKTKQVALGFVEKFLAEPL